MASGVEIKKKLVELVKSQYGVEFDDMSVEIPPRTELGDLAFPAAFELAKRLKALTGEKKNPREIASALAAGISELDGIDRVEIAGGLAFGEEVIGK